MKEQFLGSINTLFPIILQYGLSIVGAIAILIGGFWFASWISKKVQKALLNNPKIDNTLVPVTSKAVRIFFIIITILAVLNQFSIETTSIITVLGAAGLAIGLALQGTLSNVASGIMLLIFRPFRTGDVVNVKNTLCVVQEIGLFITCFRTFNHTNIYLTNSSVWGEKISNFSQNENQRRDIYVRIALDEDITRVFEAAMDELKNESKILESPAPLVAIEAIEEHYLKLLIQYWTKTADSYRTLLDMNKKIVERFNKDSIRIAVPEQKIQVETQNQKV